MLWGIVIKTNVDHAVADSIWEGKEFTQGSRHFSHSKQGTKQLKNPKKKVTPLLILYGRFSKVIIYYLASNNNIHRRPDSVVHHTGEIILWKLSSFYPKGGQLKCLEWHSDPLINEAMQQSFLLSQVSEKWLLRTQRTTPLKKRRGRRRGDNADLEELSRSAWIWPFCHMVTLGPVGGAHSLIDQSKKKRTTDQFILCLGCEQTPPDSTTGTLFSTDDDKSENVSSSKPSLLVTPPPINTEATTITTSLPEITPFIALQLRVAKLEQEMSEVKKTDHSADVVLERHTADLIEKYSVLPGPKFVKNQEKSPKEIIRAKKEQDEEKQDSTYSIRSTDKVDLEEFDLKSALFSHMNKKKSANKNTTNYRLYHALMEALIADEDAMDKEVADKVKDTRKHDMISKKPREFEASASKQHPSLSSTGWQITNTREAGVDSSMHRSDLESEHSETISTD
ncbi:hypothetical protein Tco_1351605 [Tanacetum coccineum]